jgi:hypothetical protein
LFFGKQKRLLYLAKIGYYKACGQGDYFMNSKWAVLIVIIAALGFGAGWFSKEHFSIEGYDGVQGRDEFDYDLATVYNVSMFTFSKNDGVERVRDLSESIAEALAEAVRACAKLRSKWRATTEKSSKRDNFKFIMKECGEVENY